jgi:hypothetical protein
MVLNKLHDMCMMTLSIVLLVHKECATYQIICTHDRHVMGVIGKWITHDSHRIHRVLPMRWRGRRAAEGLDNLWWGGFIINRSIQRFQLDRSQAEQMLEQWMVFFMSSVRILKVMKLLMVSLTPSQWPWCSPLSREWSIIHMVVYRLVESEVMEGTGWCHLWCWVQAVMGSSWCYWSKIS